MNTSSMRANIRASCAFCPAPSARRTGILRACYAPAAAALTPAANRSRSARKMARYTGVSLIPARFLVPCAAAAWSRSRSIVHSNERFERRRSSPDSLPPLSRSKGDRFVPQTQHVNLRKARLALPRHNPHTRWEHDRATRFRAKRETNE